MIDKATSAVASKPRALIPSTSRRGKVARPASLPSRSAPGSDCRPHGELAGTRSGSRQQKARQVRAPNQQDETHGREQRPKCETGVCDEAILQAQDPKCRALFEAICRVGKDVSLVQYLGFGARLFQTDPRFQSAEYAEGVHEAPEPRGKHGRLCRPGEPYVDSGERKLKAPRQHSNNRSGL